MSALSIFVLLNETDIFMIYIDKTTQLSKLTLVSVFKQLSTAQNLKKNHQYEKVNTAFKTYFFSKYLIKRTNVLILKHFDFTFGVFYVYRRKKKNRF